MANATFSDKSFGGLSFTNVAIAETDTGTVNSMLATAGLDYSATNVPVSLPPPLPNPYQGLSWGGFAADALAPGSTVSLTFTFDVHATAAGRGINNLQQAFTPHYQTGAGISLVAVESVYADAAHTQLVGQSTIDLGTPSATGPVAPSDFALSAAFQNLYVSVRVTVSVAAGAPAGSVVGFSAIDQGFQQTELAKQAGLGDTVWDDTNKDGIQDNGETGVSGVSVALLDANGNATGLTTTTDANGNYSFTNLNVGTYQVQFTAPIDYTFTETGQGTAATDSNADQTTGKTGLITLTAGEFDSTIDAGLVAPGSHTTTTAALGDYVWNDSNADGIQDAGETGISGVTVQLLDSSGATVLGTTTTDATGYYAFTSLAAGTYEVAFTAPTAYQFSVSGQGTPATDSNPDQFAGNVGTTEQITLADGQVDNTIDAGMYQLASLGDYVWADANSNGIQDSGETGVAGVTVNLLNGAGNVVLGTTTTNATGYYGFSSLIPGVYEVQFVAPPLASFSPTGQGTTATDSNPNTSTGVTGPITLISGQNDLTIDAGLILPPPVTPPTAQLGDRVWYDCNANGIQNSGETGVANVTVNLLDATGTTVLATTTTNSSGNYLFTSLAAGVYEVQFVAPSGRSFTAALQGSNRATDSNPDTGTGITGPITLAAGQSDLTIDAGLVKTPCTARLGDLVFQDCNGNGIQDSGDRGVGGVTVKLLNSGGAVISTTTTDSNGKYLFSNLAAGTYTVQFVAPSAMSFTTQTAGSNRAIDSNPNAAGTTGPITLAAGQTDLTIDAGLVKTPCTAKLGDYVFCDANKNGIQDSGEGGISGVTVKLLNGSGSSVLATTTTNSAGNYQFGGLAAGTYMVQFVTPASYTLSPALQGSNTAKDSNPNTSSGKTGVITLAAGQTNLTIDAGMYKTSSGGGGGGCNTGGGGNNGGWGGGGCDTGGGNGGWGGNNGGGCDTGGNNGGGGGGNGGWCDTGGNSNGGNGGGCDTGGNNNGGNWGGGGSNGGSWGGDGRDCDTVNQRDFSCGVNGGGGYGGNGGYGGQSSCFVQNGGGNGGGSWGGGGYNDCDTSHDLTNCGTSGGGYGGSYGGGYQDNSSGRQDNSWCNTGGSQNAWSGQQNNNQWSGGYSGSDSHYGSGGYCGYN